MHTLRLFVALSVVVLCFQGARRAAQHTLHPADLHEREPAHAAFTQVRAEVCQQDPDVEEPPASPWGVEDRRTLALLSREGQRLMERNAHTDMRILVKQLQLDRCSLQLAPIPDALMTPPELYAQAKESVVVVAGLYLCSKCDRWHASSATGFVISATGAIVTNYHVVNSSTKKTLVALTAQGHTLPVQRVLAGSERDDLAILQVEGEDLRPLPLAAHRDAAPVGSDVYVISHPANHFYAMTSGIVSRYLTVSTRSGEAACIDITADYARGSSGAPVLNALGQVVGIVRSTESIYYAKNPDGQPSNLQMVFKHCVPVECLKELID